MLTMHYDCLMHVCCEGGGPAESLLFGIQRVIGKGQGVIVLARSLVVYARRRSHEQRAAASRRGIHHSQRRVKARPQPFACTSSDAPKVVQNSQDHDP